MQLYMLSLPAAACDENPNIAVLVEQPLSYRDWYEYDRSYAEKMAALLYGDPDSIKRTFLAEWQDLTRETAQVFTSSYQDPEGMFSIFPANATGKIHVLALARYYRECLLKHALLGSKPSGGYPGWLQGRVPVGMPSLSPAGFIEGDALRPYTMAETLTAIHDINIPGKPFRGVTFYLLPFRISGFEGSAYTMNLPGRDEAVYLSATANPNPKNLAVAVDHELGHFIHYQYMGPYYQNPGDWERFMNLIGPTKHDKPANFVPKAYENFAECFRLIYGSSLGRQGRVYPENPSVPSLNYEVATAFRSLVEELINREDRSYFDVNRIGATITDYRGQPLSFPLGARSEQVNTIVTGFPYILITAPLNLSWGDEFTPVGACYYANTKQNPVDYSCLTVAANSTRYELTLPGPGTYTVYLGGKTDKGFTDAIQFQVIYVETSPRYR